MADGTVTRDDPAPAIHETIGLSRLGSSELVETSFEETVKALVRGEDAKNSGYESLVLPDRRDRPPRSRGVGKAATVSAGRVAS